MAYGGTPLFGDSAAGGLMLVAAVRTNRGGVLPDLNSALEKVE